MENKAKKKIYFFSYSAGTPHEMYQELFRNPPKGYEYVISDLQNDKRMTVERIAKIRKFKALDWLNKKILRKVISPHYIVQTLSRFRKIPNDVEIVHCNGCLYFGKKPWIVDMESVNTLVGHNQFMLKKNKRNIEKAFESPYCKKIITFTNFAKKTIEANLDTSKFKDKIEVIHYSTGVYSNKMKRKDKKIRLLFVGSVTNNKSGSFYTKGGREVIDVFEILNKRYKNLELVLVSSIPPEIEDRIKNIKNIKVYNRIPREQLSQIYYNCDIFFYPSFIGPGLASIEALGTGLVTVSLDIPEYDEFVENEKNGYLVRPLYYEFTENKFLSINDFIGFAKRMHEKNPQLIENLKEKIAFLIEHPKVMKKMKKYAVKKYLSEFSFDSKRMKLKKIFDEIVKERNVQL
jgi:glycosyltransferase involved in cell wall biosynthesis